MDSSVFPSVIPATDVQLSILLWLMFLKNNAFFDFWIKTAWVVTAINILWSAAPQKKQITQNNSNVLFMI